MVMETNGNATSGMKREDVQVLEEAEMNFSISKDARKKVRFINAEIYKLKCNTAAGS